VQVEQDLHPALPCGILGGSAVGQVSINAAMLVAGVLLLLGSIVGSTDAAAVFSVRLTATLEVGSGSNDPMAIFLTLALTGVIQGATGSPLALVLLFLAQFGVGTLVGLVTRAQEPATVPAQAGG
jgi:cell volume regulation protein A